MSFTSVLSLACLMGSLAMASHLEPLNLVQMTNPTTRYDYSSPFFKFGGVGEPITSTTLPEDITVDFNSATNQYVVNGESKAVVRVRVYDLFGGSKSTDDTKGVLAPYDVLQVSSHYFLAIPGNGGALYTVSDCTDTWIAPGPVENLVKYVLYLKKLGMSKKTLTVAGGYVSRQGQPRLPQGLVKGTLLFPEGSRNQEKLLCALFFQAGIITVDQMSACIRRNNLGSDCDGPIYFYWSRDVAGALPNARIRNPLPWSEIFPVTPGLRQNIVQTRITIDGFDLEAGDREVLPDRIEGLMYKTSPFEIARLLMHSASQQVPDYIIEGIRGDMHYLYHLIQSPEWKTTIEGFAHYYPPPNQEDTSYPPLVIDEQLFSTIRSTILKNQYLNLSLRAQLHIGSQLGQVDSLVYRLSKMIGDPYFAAIYQAYSVGYKPAPKGPANH